MYLLKIILKEHENIHEKNEIASFSLLAQAMSIKWLKLCELQRRTPVHFMTRLCLSQD